MKLNFVVVCAVARALSLSMSTAPRSSRRSKDLVKDLKRARRADEVSKLLQENDDLATNAFVVSAAMTKLRRFGQPRAALALFDETRTKEDFDNYNVYTYNAAISATQRLRDWARAKQLFDELQERGLEPTIHTYGSMISVAAKSRRWDDALSMFEELKARGLEPNVITYGAVISACEKTGHWEKALELFDELQASGDVTPDVVVYSALISACKKGGQFEKAFELFHELERTPGLEPDVVTYNAMIAACETDGRYEDAEELFRQLQTRGLTPTLSTFNALIASYSKGKSGDWQRAVELFEELQHFHDPTTITYNAVISTCLATGNGKKAVELFHDLQRKGLHPNVHTYNALIAACDKSKQWDKAIQLFEDLQQRGLEPDSATYGSMISAYEATRRFDDARSMFFKAHHRSCYPQLTATGELDVHDLSAPVARTAVRAALDDLLHTPRDRKLLVGESTRDLGIVTGRPDCSDATNDAVLRPAILSLLRDDDYYGGLDCVDSPDHLLVSAQSLQAWTQRKHAAAAAV